MRFLINTSEKVFAVEPCNRSDPTGIKITYTMSGLTAGYRAWSCLLVEKIYELMGWDISKKYRVYGSYLEDKKMGIFNLEEYGFVGEFKYYGKGDILMAKRRKRKPSVRANFYSIEKIIYRKKKFLYLNSPKGYLFSGATIPVKIRKEDLPPYFVPGRFKKCYGFIRTNKVKSIIYLPSKNSDHFIKDDILLISYDKEIIEDHDFGDLFGYRGYEEYIFGLDILTFIKGVKQYSPNIDTSYIEHQIRLKKESLINIDEAAYEKEAHYININDFFLGGEATS